MKNSSFPSLPPHDGLRVIVHLLEQGGASSDEIAKTINPILRERQLRTIVRRTRERYRPLLGGRYMDALEDPRLN